METKQQQHGLTSLFSLLSLRMKFNPKSQIQNPKLPTVLLPLVLFHYFPNRRSRLGKNTKPAELSAVKISHSVLVICSA